LRFRFLSAPPRPCSEDEETAVEGAGLGVAVAVVVGLIVLVVEVRTVTGATADLLSSVDFLGLDRLAGACVSDLTVLMPLHRVHL